MLADFSKTTLACSHSYIKKHIMCEFCHGAVCDKCYPLEHARRLDVLIAQQQRLLDLLEREAGYDNPPLSLIVSSPVVNTDYPLPAFEMGAILQNIMISTDATACSLSVILNHRSIPPTGRYELMRYQGSGTFPPLNGKITLPANSTIIARFNALSGGTFLAVSASYSRSEQTGIEWFRSQRLGRVG